MRLGGVIALLIAFILIVIALISIKIFLLSILLLLALVLLGCVYQIGVLVEDMIKDERKRKRGY